MRRRAFYLAVALLAFGIGSFVVFKFYWSEKIITNSKIQLFETVDAQQQKNEYPQTKIEDIEDEELVDENLEEKFKPIIRKWLKGQKIEEKYLSHKTYKEAKDYDPENFTPSLTDVNFDGKKELAIKSDCSPTGNCLLFIYEKIGKEYRTILTSVHDVNVFKFRKVSNKNYRNIEARMHGSWNSGDGVIYVFNGKEYKPAKCFGYIYEEYKDKKGNTKTRNTPKFEYYDCNFEE
jgi:serine/threonine-protein kinase RIO1